LEPRLGVRTVDHQGEEGIELRLRIQEQQHVSDLIRVAHESQECLAIAQPEFADTESLRQNRIDFGHGYAAR